MFNLILFGPPGSGKGTQSEKIVEKFGLIHLSTGNLLRQEIADKTPLGLEAKNIIEKGQLVPDEVVIGMIDSSIEKHPDAKGFLFDGFPRTTAQAKALDNLLAVKKTSIHKVIALDVIEEELVSRLLKRGETSGRSDDVNESVIRRRYAVYKKETEPVAEYYKDQDKFIVIKGVGTIEEISRAVTNAIESQMANLQSVSAQ
ncbi:MAG TPA: adenylate kinase [Flavisolibacter sp.]|jgi:adenylate kinase|nr:adenylate kinase [Flavisolibacter sp.]